MSDLQRVQERYRRFAENECKGYSDHYYRLSHEIANDGWLLEFIAQMPETQPNLFLASLQFLSGPEDMPHNAEQTRSLVARRREEVEHLMRSRRTQTNEPGRCATLLPALPRGPLALLEVGASAGLCLLLDEYAYEYESVRLGPESSPVRLRCAVVGNVPLPEVMPQIVWRAGLDLRPVDVHDADDARWLVSCVWPEHAERRERLAAAISLAKLRDLTVHRGDLVADLPKLIATAPRDATLVVFHSAVLCYVNEEARRDFADTLAEASKQRDIVWISNEAPTVVPEITALAPAVKGPRFLLGRTRFTKLLGRTRFTKLLGRTQLAKGRRQDEFLAIAQAHGAELEWLAREEVTRHDIAPSSRQKHDESSA